MAKDSKTSGPMNQHKEMAMGKPIPQGNKDKPSTPKK